MVLITHGFDKSPSHKQDKALWWFEFSQISNGTTQCTEMTAVLTDLYVVRLCSPAILGPNQVASEHISELAAIIPVMGTEIEEHNE